MLIDFTVENYRSIKEPVILSAIATKTRSTTKPVKRRLGVVPDDEIAPPYEVEGRGFELLPVLGIFGANASGKTNVLRALDELTRYMESGFFTYDRGSEPRATSFALDKEYSKKPSRFEFTTYLLGNVYKYSIAVLDVRIVEETLEFIPVGQPSKRFQLLYQRKLNQADNTYAWRNGKELGNAYLPIQHSLREHEPFVSELSRHIRVEAVAPLTNWLSLRWSSTGLTKIDSVYDDTFLKVWLTRRGNALAQAAAMVNRFDTGLANVEMSARLSGSPDRQDYSLYGVHIVNGNSTRLPFEEESDGTQRLLLLATKLLQAFDTKSLLTIDELGSNLHPTITREIVRLFQDPKTNPKRAQLIFTSHDNTLLDDNLLRRDQIWFTEKREDGSTNLYSLSDFRPRNDLAIDKAYLDGRFGAVPFLPEHDELLPHVAEAA